MFSPQYHSIPVAQLLMGAMKMEWKSPKPFFEFCEVSWKKMSLNQSFNAGLHRMRSSCVQSKLTQLLAQIRF